MRTCIFLFNLFSQLTIFLSVIFIFELNQYTKFHFGETILFVILAIMWSGIMCLTKKITFKNNKTYLASSLIAFCLQSLGFGLAVLINRENGNSFVDSFSYGLVFYVSLQFLELNIYPGFVDKD